jgi:phenylacetate-CoA ligase
MKFDFSSYPLKKAAYSERPMSFLEAGPSAVLGAIFSLAFIETGNRTAREQWQKAQLRNLLKHATQRSGFWRSRLGPKPSDGKLDTLPILTRADVKAQVLNEGSLLGATDGLRTAMHSTSGSSGMPVQFFVSQMNVQYNGARYLAQNFIDGKDLSLNKTRIRTAKYDAARKIAVIPSGFAVEKNSSWLGDLESAIKSGELKQIDCVNPNVRDLVRELRKDPVGYLVANPRMVSMIISRSGVELLRELEVREWSASAEGIDPALFREIAGQGISVRSNYSSEEVGPIAFECETIAGHYHVATSNVMVEVVDVSHEIDGRKLGRVLVTHLHSYATPFIRYDMGDLALLELRCPCGHDGLTIHSLYGRVTNALKRRDGTLAAFLIRGSELSEILQFSEFRVRQVNLDIIVIEIGGREKLTPEEIEGVVKFLKIRAGDDFKINVIACPTIEWGDSAKKLSFRCEI